MNRITPERAVAAYQKIGAVPIQGRYLLRSDSGLKCCALTAVALADGAIVRDCEAHRVFDVFGAQYANDFRRGFDHLVSERVVPDSVKASVGYQDGWACWEAVKNLDLSGLSTNAAEIVSRNKAAVHVQPVGSICLYGGQSCGYGYLAGPPDSPAQFGDGEPRIGRGLNDSFWLGMLDLKEAGHVGNVEVFAPGGRLMATANNSGTLPYYGKLTWGPAPTITISMEDVIAAATPAQDKKGGAT